MAHAASASLPARSQVGRPTRAVAVEGPAEGLVAEVFEAIAGQVHLQGRGGAAVNTEAPTRLPTSAETTNASASTSTPTRWATPPRRSANRALDPENHPAALRDRGSVAAKQRIPSRARTGAAKQQPPPHRIPPKSHRPPADQELGEGKPESASLQRAETGHKRERRAAA